MTRNRGNSSLVSGHHFSLKVVLIVVLIAGVVCLGVFLWFKRSQARAYWQKQEVYRLLVVDTANPKEGKYYLVEYFPTPQQLQILEIPEKLTVDTPSGYGKYRIGALLALGDQEGRGDQILSSSVQSAFGVFVADVLLSENLPSFREAKTQWVRAVSVSLIRAGIGGRIEIADAFEVGRKWFLMPEPDISTQSLADLRVLDEISDVDGQNYPVLNRLRWDNYYRDWVGEHQNDLVSSIQIAVDNTTAIPGLATSLARLLAHEGFDVVSIADSDAILEESLFVFASQELVEGLAGKMLLKRVPQVRVLIGNTEGFRSDVVLRLGKDQQF